MPRPDDTIFSKFFLVTSNVSNTSIKNYIIDTARLKGMHQSPQKISYHTEDSENSKDPKVGSNIMVKVLLNSISVY